MLKGFQIATLDVDFGSQVNMVADIAKLGANAIRYQLVAYDPRYMGELPAHLDYRGWSWSQYETWWWSKLNDLLVLIHYVRAHKLKIKFILDCHSPFGGADLNSSGRNVHKCVVDDSYRRKWEALWLATVDYFQNDQEIVMFDLLNEPSALASEWGQAACKLAKKIRQLEKSLRIDQRWISITTPGGRTEDFEDMKDIDISKISMQSHIYLSQRLSTIFLRKTLKPAIRYCRRNKKPLYLGEVGAHIKYGAEQVKLFFELFLPMLEENKLINTDGGGHTIHAWKESLAYNYEGTAALEIIKKYFNK